MITSTMNVNGTAVIDDLATARQIGAECKAAALDYQSRGFSVTAVCPPDHSGVGETHKNNCNNPGKAPWGAWKDLQTTPMSAEDILKKWCDNPRLNVGIALGPVSGAVRVDEDGKAGYAKLVELCGGEPPATWEFSSGGNGRGLLFRIPPGVELKTTTMTGDGVHEELRIQAKGAQTVMPPSLHASGRRYTWRPGRGPDDIDMAMMPPWMVELMRVKLRAAPSNNGTTFKQSATGRTDDQTKAIEALNYFVNRAAGYDVWLAVGQILQAVGLDVGLWESWSRSCPEKHRDGVCDRKWKSFNRDGGLGLGTLIMWAREASPSWTPSWTRQSSAQASKGQEPDGLAAAPITIIDVVLAYMKKKFDPTFRRGDHLWSNSMSREIMRGEACAAPTSNIIEDLLAAVDFPREAGHPKRSAVPSIFRQWAPIAWADLLASLPEEPDTSEVSQSASEQFEAAVADCLMTIEAFAHVIHDGKQTRTEIQRRSLIDWCKLFAKTGPWQSVRSLKLWCRRTDGGELQIAIHQRLFGQIRRGNLMPGTHRKFAALCEAYGVGESGRTSRSAFVELSRGFIADVDSSPCDGPCDGEDDVASPRACEGAASLGRDDRVLLFLRESQDFQRHLADERNRHDCLPQRRDLELLRRLACGLAEFGHPVRAECQFAVCCFRCHVAVSKKGG